VSLLLTTIATEVAGEFGSKLSSILAPTRGKPEDARARAIAMFAYGHLMPDRRPDEPMCKTAIGAVFGRDRTTVAHALLRVVGFAANEPDFVERFNSVVMRVRAKQ
jgi:chromosomal replication initiation ATPase DnaA